MFMPVLVSCAVGHGIAGAVDLKRVGRVGVKALIFVKGVTMRSVRACSANQVPPWSARSKLPGRVVESILARKLSPGERPGEQA